MPEIAISKEIPCGESECGECRLCPGGNCQQFRVALCSIAICNAGESPQMWSTVRCPECLAAEAEAKRIRAMEKRLADLEAAVRRIAEYRKTAFALVAPPLQVHMAELIDAAIALVQPEETPKDVGLDTDADDVLREQERNYNADVSASIRPFER